MAKHMTNKRSSKQLKVTKSDQVYIGLDVHKHSVHAAIRINGRLIATRVIPASTEAVITTLSDVRAGINKVVYEAGPTGFGLARALINDGLPVDVVAPGKTPQPANQDNKSDRLDCIKLAEFAEKGLLKPVCIPTEREEADRLVTRIRDQLIKKQRRTKQQIRSLLLQFGIAEPAGLDHWTLAAVAALRTLQQPWQIRLALDTLLDELAELKRLVLQTERRLRKLAKTKRYEHPFQILSTHPGVGEITSMKFAAEMYRPARFTRSTQVVCYLGLAPRVRQSGKTRKQGGIQKSGRSSLRALLIEASWQWRRVDTGAARLYDRIVHNTGSSQKAIVALARHMAINLWHMLIRQQPYRPVPIAV